MLSKRLKNKNKSKYKDTHFVSLNSSNSHQIHDIAVSVFGTTHYINYDSLTKTH